MKCDISIENEPVWSNEQHGKCRNKRFVSLDMYVHVLQVYKQCDKSTMKEKRGKGGHLGGQLFKQMKKC